MDLQQLRDAARVAEHILTANEQRAIETLVKRNGVLKVNWVVRRAIGALLKLNEYCETDCYNELIEQLYVEHS